MKSLKKTVIAVLVIGVLSVAGVAFASHGRGKGQAGPMGPFGGHRPMMGQPWNGDNLPPTPPAGPEGFRPCGRMGAMGPMFGRQPAPFPPVPGQGFCGQGFGHRGGPAFGNQGRRGPRMGQFQPCPGFVPNRPQPFFGQGFGHGRGPVFGPEAQGPRGDRFPRRGRFSPDMPQEVRAKVVEAAKLRIDLEDVLSQKPLNRKKALELNGKISKLKQEIRAWRFEQKLDRIEESNRKPAEDAEKTE